MAAPAPGKLIVVVDDDATVRTMVRQALETKGYEVMEAADGLQASQLFERLSRQPSLLICDVMMPSMDGPTTFREMQRSPEIANIPVVLLTAKVQGVEQRRFAGLGVAGVLFKPFDPLTLAEQMAATLGWS